MNVMGILVYCLFPFQHGQKYKGMINASSCSTGTLCLQLAHVIACAAVGILCASGFVSGAAGPATASTGAWHPYSGEFDGTSSSDEPPPSTTCDDAGKGICSNSFLSCERYSSPPSCACRGAFVGCLVYINCPFPYVQENVLACENLGCSINVCDPMLATMSPTPAPSPSPLVCNNYGYNSCETTKSNCLNNGANTCYCLETFDNCLGRYWRWRWFHCQWHKRSAIDSTSGTD